MTLDIVSQVGGEDHKMEKELALVVMPERLRIPLPCPQLPELVLKAINTIAVRSALQKSHLVMNCWEQPRQLPFRAVFGQGPKRPLQAME